MYCPDWTMYTGLLNLRRQENKPAPPFLSESGTGFVSADGETLI